jgi:hypothetical protein
VAEAEVGLGEALLALGDAGAAAPLRRAVERLEAIVAVQPIAPHQRSLARARAALARAAR